MKLWTKRYLRDSLMKRQYWRDLWEIGKLGAEYKERGESLNAAQEHARADLRRQGKIKT